MFRLTECFSWVPEIRAYYCEIVGHAVRSGACKILTSISGVLQNPVWEPLVYSISFWATHASSFILTDKQVRSWQWYSKKTKPQLVHSASRLSYRTYGLQAEKKFIRMVRHIFFLFTCCKQKNEKGNKTIRWSDTVPDIGIVRACGAFVFFFDSRSGLWLTLKWPSNKSVCFLSHASSGGLVGNNFQFILNKFGEILLPIEQKCKCYHPKGQLGNASGGKLTEWVNVGE